MEHTLDRVWFLTWRTYGTWLPGDERGHVTAVIDDAGRRVVNNDPGMPMFGGNERLRTFAESNLKGPPVLLAQEHTDPLADQFRETARYRKWVILGFSILVNHVHLVVLVRDDPEGFNVLRDFKSYGSRRLNALFGKPVNGSWWAESGSNTIVKTDANLELVMRYVNQQAGALLTWVIDEWPGRESGAVGNG